MALLGCILDDFCHFLDEMANAMVASPVCPAKKSFPIFQQSQKRLDIWISIWKQNHLKGPVLDDDIFSFFLSEQSTDFDKAAEEAKFEF